MGAPSQAAYARVRQQGAWGSTAGETRSEAHRPMGAPSWAQPRGRAVSAEPSRARASAAARPMGGTAGETRSEAHRADGGPIVGTTARARRQRRAKP
eukprot:1669258-Alexandrium_andersonii.AAC.1